MEEKNPDVTITVIVDAQGITNDSTTLDPSKDTVKNYVNLVDNLGDKEDKKGDSTTFDTKVTGQASIVWHAQSTDGVDSIHMTKIAPDNAGDYFSDGPKQKEDGSEDWEATTVSNENGTGTLEFQYYIKFTINGGKQVYTLDPKLQIRKPSS
ncbi:hypothetical protein [Winogradskyella tangerina]|uniref:hypothetical protein n=1 Tax=Winogradskyella tangerina TaxID=2023240 RepID=UPI000DBE10E0|nr:hypothetical protein [Winogradskyella tangerina]